MKTRTLVIHPKDPTTDFLIEIYRGRNFTEIREDFDPKKLKTLIQDHHRILLLGHGYHNGLLNYYQTIIDDSFASLLKNKEVVGIWCYAKAFFDRNNLSGFYTDMFISELNEAIIMGVPASHGDIEISNQQFAKAVRNNLFKPDCWDRIHESYCRLKSPVALYNQDRLYCRTQEGTTMGCEQPCHPSEMSAFIQDQLSELSLLIQKNPDLISSFIPKNN